MALRVWFNSMNCQANQNLFFAGPLLLSLWLHEAQIETFQYFHASLQKKKRKATNEDLIMICIFTFERFEISRFANLGQYYFRPQ
jgi:hypothetical protein